jgi:DNA-binding GntR family transcriptional regulator
MRHAIGKISESENQPLYKVVYSKLREAILNGQLAPGTKLVEEAISNQMQISKTPVREAIRELAQEGLISFKARHGITVIDFTEKDIKELVILRAALEVLGVRFAKDYWGEADTSVLESILERIIAAEKAHNYAALPNLDIEFHKYVIEKTGNQRLVKAWKDIASQMNVLFRIIRYFEFSEGYTSTSHKELIVAISTMDKNECENVFRAHIQLNEQNILSSFHNRREKKD